MEVVPGIVAGRAVEAVVVLDTVLSEEHLHALRHNRVASVLTAVVTGMWSMWLVEVETAVAAAT